MPPFSGLTARLVASQYLGTSSYLEQQLAAKYNGTSSIQAKFGWYPRVGGWSPPRSAPTCCAASRGTVATWTPVLPWQQTSNSACVMQNCNQDLPGICEIPKAAFGCPSVRDHGRSLLHTACLLPAPRPVLQCLLVAHP
jgi:hypothetical protein